MVGTHGTMLPRVTRKSDRARSSVFIGARAKMELCVRGKSQGQEVLFPMKVRGILRGQTIELLDTIKHVPDGAEVSVELEFADTPHIDAAPTLTEEERFAKLNRLFGAWAHRPDLDEAFARVDRERHAERGRAIDSLDR
ncbi:MAG: hypothetical protein AAFY57_06855 [Cyanobacteria bacterium J06642_2]